MSTNNSIRKLGRTLTVVASIMTILLVTACGSTKVYNNDKTVVYRDAVYNISKVKQINSKISGKLADDTSVNLAGVERKQIEA